MNDLLRLYAEAAAGRFGASLQWQLRPGTGPHLGCVDRDYAGKPRVWIAPDLDDATAWHVLTHELGHLLAGHAKGIRPGNAGVFPYREAPPLLQVLADLKECEAEAWACKLADFARRAGPPTASYTVLTSRLQFYAI